jgi:hypothetical protein
MTHPSILVGQSGAHGHSILMITKALDFAARKHAEQRRKGAQAEPYINHLAEVAQLLAEATGGMDATLVAAGLLHDTIEDTGATHDELVREVTDDKSLPKAERKQLQVDHAPHKSPRAKMIKIADKTSNLRAVLTKVRLQLASFGLLHFFLDREQAPLYFRHAPQMTITQREHRTIRSHDHTQLTCGTAIRRSDMAVKRPQGGALAPYRPRDPARTGPLPGGPNPS